VVTLGQRLVAVHRSAAAQVAEEAAIAERDAGAASAADPGGEPA
jgi:hypothetical protein